jgi:hypothetical protein
LPTDLSWHVHSACAQSQFHLTISPARMVQKSLHTILGSQSPAREHADGHRHAWLAFEVRFEWVDELPLDLE